MSNSTCANEMQYKDVVDSINKYGTVYLINCSPKQYKVYGDISKGQNGNYMAVLYKNPNNKKQSYRFNDLAMCAFFPSLLFNAISCAKLEFEDYEFHCLYGEKGLRDFLTKQKILRNQNYDEFINHHICGCVTLPGEELMFAKYDMPNIFRFAS